MQTKLLAFKKDGKYLDIALNCVLQIVFQFTQFQKHITKTERKSSLREVKQLGYCTEKELQLWLGHP